MKIEFFDDLDIQLIDQSSPDTIELRVRLKAEVAAQIVGSLMPAIEFLSSEIYRKRCERYEKEQFLHSMVEYHSRVRMAAIASLRFMRKDGLSISAASRRLGVFYDVAPDSIRSAINFARRERDRRLSIFRERAVIRLYMGGYSFQSISEKFGYTVWQVRQLVKRHGSVVEGDINGKRHTIASS